MLITSVEQALDKLKPGGKHYFIGSDKVGDAMDVEYLVSIAAAYVVQHMHQGGVHLESNYAGELYARACEWYLTDQGKLYKPFYMYTGTTVFEPPSTSQVA